MRNTKRICNCINCGKELSKNKYTRCKFCSHKSKKNSNWRGGISKEGYSYKFSNFLKEKIRNRDSQECALCEISQKEHIKKFLKKLFVHHIDYNKKNYEENNLITLCLVCNIKVNKDRNKWEEILRRQDQQLRILNLIRNIAIEYPQLRFMQLLGNCFPPGDNYHIEDDILYEKLKVIYRKPKARKCLNKEV